MQVSRALVKESPRNTVLDMSAELKRLAERGDWAELERVAVLLRRAVVEVPEAERAEVLRAAARATDAAEHKAKAAHEDVMGRLKAIRRGQNATRAYGETTGRFPVLKTKSS